MNEEIERLDRQRMKNLQWHLVGLGSTILLMLARHFLRSNELNDQPIGYAVLGLLVLSLVVNAATAIGIVSIGNRVRQDPALSEALYNELVQSLEASSWRAAYWGAVGMAALFAVTWFFYPVCDPVAIALTSILGGAFAYQASFYFRYRAS
ncbi:MAG TPA: hypothetical protein G4O08_01110 [Anaerolineae bacterium]|nr:hypothetical protein [Anaerolineae bacterium]